MEKKKSAPKTKSKAKASKLKDLGLKKADKVKGGGGGTKPEQTHK